MTLKQWLDVDAPVGWNAVFVRTAIGALVGFITLQVKEWSETHAFDTPDAFLGAAWFAVTTFAVGALLKRSKP